MNTPLEPQILVLVPDGAPLDLVHVGDAAAVSASIASLDSEDLRCGKLDRPMKADPRFEALQVYGGFGVSITLS